MIPEKHTSSFVQLGRSARRLGMFGRKFPFRQFDRAETNGSGPRRRSGTSLLGVKATGRTDECRRWPRCRCAEPRATLGSSSRLAMAIDRAWRTGRSAVRLAGGVVFSSAARKKPST